MNIIKDIPQYPNSFPLELSHKEVLDSYFEQVVPMISEFSFTGMFLFRKSHKYKVTREKNEIFFLGEEKGKKFAVFPFFVPNATLLEFLQKEVSFIKIISDQQKKIISQYISIYPSWKLKTDRGDFDYMYRRKDLEELKGRKFHKKRNLIHNFQKLYPQAVSKDIDYRMLNDVRLVLDVWEARNNSKERVGDDDYYAVCDTIAHFDLFPLFGRITYIEETPIAFVLGELTHGGKCCIVHFEKADISYMGIYQHISQEFIATLPESCIVINKEQDLNFEGLRQAKETYRPRAFLKKHRLFLHD